MSEIDPTKILQAKLIISEEMFMQFKQDIDYRNFIKRELAHEISKVLVESKNIQFTYIRDPITFSATVKARLELR